MPQPLLELQRLLAGRISVAGRVVSVNRGVAKVATSAGIVEVATSRDVQAGDRVTIKDGQVSKSQNTPSAAVFFV